MRDPRRPRARVCALGVAAALLLSTVAACDGDESSEGSGDDTTEVGCELGALALGAIVTAITRGRTGDEIGEFVSSQGVGNALSAACEQFAIRLANDRTQQFTFDLELDSGAVQRQSVFGSDLLAPPTGTTEPSLLDCFDWKSDFLFQLCIDRVIDPPVG